MAVGLFTALIEAFLVNGIPANGGLLNTYAAGTTTPIATYIDSTGLTAFTSPITLNARGEPQTALGASAGIWGTVGTAYKFQLTDALSNVLWTIDNVFPNVSTAFVGDSGSGGAGGLVPAPPSGSAAANQYLSASGAFAGLLVTPPSASIARNQAGYLGMPVGNNGVALTGNYTLQLSDIGCVLPHNSASPHTITIPANSSVAWPTTFLVVIGILNVPGQGVFTIAPAAGVSLYSPPSFSTSGNRSLQANGFASLLGTALNTWVLVGAGIS